jgi:hypothetical protein
MGKIVSETADKIELQYMSTNQSIDKSQVVSKTQMETSLMPGNLHSSMSQEELVDLIEYLSGLNKAMAAN